MRTFQTLPLANGGHSALRGVEGGGQDDPVVVLLPAMGIPAGYYGPFLTALAEHGVAAVTADFPGQGESRPLAGRAVDYGYGHLAREFVPQMLEAVGENFPGRPIVLAGHSLGGHVALAHLALESVADVRGLVIIGSGAPYWRSYARPLRILAQTQAIALVARVRGHWPGHRLGFGGRQPRALMLEWAAFARTGHLVPRGTKAAMTAGLAALRLPVLIVDLDNDHLAPPRAVDALIGMIPGASVERWTALRVPGSTARPMDHYTWARDPEGVADRVADWVRARA
ncbi:alpha/beta hydrolase family protein [Janibacter sp. G56]|uniref:alpha/beta hydrolase family protein n=1 Tax=Janibacter sp. G56 TaxID=3418717 RepID=UPI003D027B59